MNKVYGLYAISASNGWAIAAVGITIVFTGLVILSFIISQLHKVLALIEKGTEKFADFYQKKNSGKNSNNTEKTVQYVLNSLSAGEKESVKQLSCLVGRMDEHFSLPKLVRLAEISDLDNSFAGINTLLDSGIIGPDTEGYFLWDENRFKKLVNC